MRRSWWLPRVSLGVSFPVDRVEEGTSFIIRPPSRRAPDERSPCASLFQIRLPEPREKVDNLTGSYGALRWQLDEHLNGDSDRKCALRPDGWLGNPIGGADHSEGRYPPSTVDEIAEEGVLRCYFRGPRHGTIWKACGVCSSCLELLPRRGSKHDDVAHGTSHAPVCPIKGAAVRSFLAPPRSLELSQRGQGWPAPPMSKHVVSASRAGSRRRTP